MTARSSPIHAQETAYAPIEDAGYHLALDLGDPFGPGEEDFQRITDAAFDQDHRSFWVLETDRLRRFTDGGKVLMELGREGSGPGEFMSASMLRVDSLVRAYDFRLARETRFDREGTLVGTVTGVLSDGMTVVLDEGRSLVVTAARFSPFGGTPSDPDYHLILVEGEDRDTLASIRSGGFVYFHRENRYPWSMLSTGQGDLGGWDLSGDSLLVIADGRDGSVRWLCLSPGPTPCGRGDTGLEARPVTVEDTDALRKRAADGGSLPLRLIEITEQPEWVPVATSVVIADNGRSLWIQNEGDERGGRRWSVLGRDGRVSGRYAFSDPVRVLSVSQRGILGVRLGDYDEPHLVWWAPEGGAP